MTIASADRLRRAMAPREWLGAALGVAWAPALAAVSKARHARALHPVGYVHEAQIEALADEPVAARLAGRGLVRFSAALWKQWERLDVLGIALRASRRTGPWDETAHDGDQDLLFATIRSPFTMGIAPLTTRSDDFLGNRYFAVSPFAIGEPRHVKLRLSPMSPREDAASSGGRAERLRAAVAAGRADFRLEMRRTFSRGYEPIARVALGRAVAVDDQALRFDPFRTGAGIVPSGLVHAIRRAVYPASQAARPAR
jgi:hypothetical protein